MELFIDIVKSAKKVSRKSHVLVVEDSAMHKNR